MKTQSNSYLTFSSLLNILFQMTGICFYAKLGGICKIGFQSVNAIVEYTSNLGLGEGREGATARTQFVFKELHKLTWPGTCLRSCFISLW